MCPLAHPLLPESGAATAASRDDMCVPSSAEADRCATLSLILTGVTGFEWWVALLQQWPRPAVQRPPLQLIYSKLPALRFIVKLVV